MAEILDLSKVRDARVEAQIAASEKRASDLANIHGPCLEGMENLMGKIKVQHAVIGQLRANIYGLTGAVAVLIMRSHVAAQADGKVGELAGWPLRVTDGEVQHLKAMGLGLNATRDGDDLVFTLKEDADAADATQ